MDDTQAEAPADTAPAAEEARPALPLSLVIASLASAALAACGGGGGDDPPPPTGGPTPTPTPSPTPTPTPSPSPPPTPASPYALDPADKGASR